MFPLWYYRKMAGLTHKAIGERCGVSMSAVSLWESGKTVPRKRHWPVLEEMLNISEKQLLDSIEEGRKRCGLEPNKGKKRKATKSGKTNAGRRLNHEKAI